MKIDKLNNIIKSFSVQYLSKKRYVTNIIKGQNIFIGELLYIPTENGGSKGNEVEKVNKV
tara:strand:+ start:301 stop:480 length:180 start_codon:yes stop_codon:yes gene_type:complete